MAEEVLENPVTGERLQILESTPERFKVKYSLAPHGEIPGAHFHPGKEQQVTVLSGEMHLLIAGGHRVVRAGESALVPLGAHHFQWNPCEAEVVAIEEVFPAGRLHEFFSVLFRLARDGRTDARGLPPPLLASVLFAEFRDTIRQASFGARLTLDALVPLATVLGYRRLLERYLGSPVGTSSA
ncbi:MAG: cupin domain-containing protein [Candidatus Binatia bacterium]